MFDLLLFLSSGITYYTGKLIAMVFLPHLQIDSFERQRTLPRRWTHRKFTYDKDGKRCLYMESIEMIGTAFWLVVLSFFIWLKVV